MRFYITGRSSNYPKVDEAFKRIKDLGHNVTFEWTSLPVIKPYCENTEKAAEYAILGIKGVIEADVYIIFSHEDGNGIYTELGAALATHEINGTLKIYAIGNEQSVAMFNYHPAIIWKGSLDDVLLECV